MEETRAVQREGNIRQRRNHKAEGEEDQIGLTQIYQLSYIINVLYWPPIGTGVRTLMGQRLQQEAIGPLISWVVV